MRKMTGSIASQRTLPKIEHAARPRHSEIHKEIAAHSVRLVVVQERAQKTRTTAEIEAEVDYIPFLVKKINKMNIFLNSCFNLKDVYFAIIGSSSISNAASARTRLAVVARTDTIRITTKVWEFRMVTTFFA
jgi:hypothetical protein